jgi:hypothetical protein
MKCQQAIVTRQTTLTTIASHIGNHRNLSLELIKLDDILVNILGLQFEEGGDVAYLLLCVHGEYVTQKRL